MYIMQKKKKLYSLCLAYISIHIFYENEVYFSISQILCKYTGWFLLLVAFFSFIMNVGVDAVNTY